MTAFLQVWKSTGVELIPLSAGRNTVGRASANDVVIDDRQVSVTHAVVEMIGNKWIVRDVRSTNGTFFRGERIQGEHVLRNGDELRLGATRIVFTVDDPCPVEATEAGAGGAPELTRRERDVLHALCRPLAARYAGPFTEPASLRDVAEELVVSEAAVKHHLARLYEKFGLADRRRVVLANEAMRTGAVTLADLQRKA